MLRCELTTTTFLAGFFFLMSMALKSMPPATVTYRLNVCSCIPCSFSISTLYSPSSSCFTLENPRMIWPGALVQLLHLGSVDRSLESCDTRGLELDINNIYTITYFEPCHLRHGVAEDVKEEVCVVALCCRDLVRWLHILWFLALGGEGGGGLVPVLEQQSSSEILRGNVALLDVS